MANKEPMLLEETNSDLNDLRRGPLWSDEGKCPAGCALHRWLSLSTMVTMRTRAPRLYRLANFPVDREN